MADFSYFERDKSAATKKYTLDTENIPKMVDKAIKFSKSVREKWVEQARMADYYTAGHQWDEEDKEYLRSQKRPVVTFNRILKTLMLMVGIEINHRQEPLAVARNPNTPGQKELADITTAYLRWVLDNCEGDEERTAAAFDNFRRGMGWEELSIAYDENPDGEILLKRVDGFEMWWDASAKEPNLKDTRWRARRRFMPYEEVAMLFGKDKADELETAEFDPDDEPTQVTNISPIGYAPGNSQLRSGGKHAGPYLITQFQWWNWKKFYRTLDPDSLDPKDPDKGTVTTIPADKWDRFEKGAKAKGIEAPQKYETWQKQFRQTFVSGDVELKTVDLPVNDFTLMAMTGLWDQKDKIFFGLVRPMKDPQEWANKFYSQTMDIMNRARKNAILLKRGAVDDPRKFEKEINSPGGVSLMNDLEGYKELTSTQLPSGLEYLLESAIHAIPDCSGVNVELLGQSEGDQPGVTTMARQTQGMTVVAPFFNSERRLRMKETRLLIEYGRKFVADGRLIRVGGPQNSQYIQLFREQMATEYDLILDENPRNPNARMAVWTEMMPFMQVALKGGMFGILAEMIDYAPMPAQIIEGLKKELLMLDKMKKSGAMQGQGKPGQKQPNPQLDQAKMMKLGAGAQLDMARARALDAASKLKAGDAHIDRSSKVLDMAHKHTEHLHKVHHDHRAHMRDEQSHIMDMFGDAIEAAQNAQPQQEAA